MFRCYRCFVSDKQTSGRTDERTRSVQSGWAARRSFDKQTSRQADEQTNDEQTSRRADEQTDDKLAKMEVVDIGQRTE